MRRAAIFLAVLVAVFLLAGCVRGGDAPQPEKKAEIPSTARIVCDKEGTRVLTSRVGAQPDGVHFVIDNRLAGSGGYTVALPASKGPLYSGAGGNAARGISKHVEPFSPGMVKISCNPPRFSGEEKELDLCLLRGPHGRRRLQVHRA
jgi:hypothetical protein